MATVLVQQGLTLLWLALWCMTVIGVGRLALRAADSTFHSRAELLFVSAAVGLVAVGYTVFLFGVAGALAPAAIALLLAILALCALAGWLGPIPLRRSPPPRNRPQPERIASLLLALLVALAFVQTMTPEIAKDALIYHLAVPKRYLLHHGFHFIPGNIFAGYPLLGEMHYLLALSVGNDTLARAIHFMLLCATLLGIGLFARHLLREHRFPVLSMLLFASIPTVFAVSHAAYNDLFVAFFTLAALYAFFRWSADRGTPWLRLCGLFSGAAPACKYNALLLAPLGVLGLLWLARQRREPARATFGALLLYLAVALAAGSPFYLKNWITLGNPFYPFFHHLFGGRGWDADQARLYDLFIRNLGMGREALDYLLLPWNLSVHAEADSPRFDGILGPLFLLTLPLLAFIRRLEGPLVMTLLFVLAGFLFWASSAQQMRYLIPLFALLALAVGAVATRLRANRPLFALLVCLIAGSLAFNARQIATSCIRTNPIPVALGLETREAFLARSLSPYPIYRLLNEHLPADARVYLIYVMNYSFLCERDCYADAMFETYGLGKILRTEPSPEGIAGRLKREGFTHLFYDERYLLGDRSPLAEAERRRFATFREARLRNLLRQGPYRVDALI